MSNCDFVWELALKVGVIFSRWDLKTLVNTSLKQTKNFFSCLVARGLENFKFLGALLFWGDLISILAKGD